MIRTDGRVWTVETALPFTDQGKAKALIFQTHFSYKPMADDFQNRMQLLPDYKVGPVVEVAR
jgi:hypothetical protein